MAEAILRSAAGDLMDVYSAGSNPKGEVHPLAIEAIEALGISTKGHRSKHLENYLNAGITTVITVCGNANQACPIFPGIVKRYHWGFDDPPDSIRSGETERDAFYRIRDSIKLVFEAYASGYIDAINQNSEYEK